MPYQVTEQAAGFGARHRTRKPNRRGLIVPSPVRRAGREIETRLSERLVVSAEAAMGRRTA